MKENESYDVCIVGGGLGGSTLAFNLSSKLDVCIVEKKPFEELGSDPCGNAVHKSWFDSDGIGPKPSDFGAVASEVDSIEVHFPEEKWRSNLPPGRTGFIIDKKKYVRSALEASLDDGADLFQGSAKPVYEDGGVRGVKVDGKKLRAEVYVDASGPSAVLRTQFFPNPKGALFRGYREIVDRRLPEESLHGFQDGPNSAFWAFPMGERTNVGGAAFRDGVKLKKGTEKLKNKLGFGEGEVLEADFGSILSYRPIDLVRGNTIAIGDAGFTVNPVTGGGIGPTVKASNILAETLKKGDSPTDFQDKYREEVAGGYERNYQLSRLFLKLQPLLWKRATKWALKMFYGGKKVEEKSEKHN